MVAELIQRTDPFFKAPLKVEASAHHPKGTALLAETEAGPIYRMPVEARCFPNQQVPEWIQRELGSRKTRQFMKRMFHWNSRKGPEIFGRANSAFLSKWNGAFYIDHLLEDAEHERLESPKIHDFIRAAVNYNNAEPISELTRSLSGHIAPLNISTPEIAYAMVLDKFIGPDAYRGMNADFQHMVHSLLRGRILPMTSDAWIIKPV